MSVAAGTKLGRYEIRAKIGEGGIDEVYVARDAQLDLALKILTAEVTRGSVAAVSIPSGGAPTSALSHPNVAHIYELAKPTVRTSSRWNTSKVKASTRRSAG